MRGGAYYWLALASSGARSSCGGEERGAAASDDSIEVLKWDWSGEGADLVRRRASTSSWEIAERLFTGLVHGILAVGLKLGRHSLRVTSY